MSLWHTRVRTRRVHFPTPFPPCLHLCLSIRAVSVETATLVEMQYSKLCVTCQIICVIMSYSQLPEDMSAKDAEPGLSPPQHTTFIAFLWKLLANPTNVLNRGTAKEKHKVRSRATNSPIRSREVISQPQRGKMDPVERKRWADFRHEGSTFFFFFALTPRSTIWRQMQNVGSGGEARCKIVAEPVAIITCCPPRTIN